MSRICFQDSYYRKPGYQTHFGTNQKKEGFRFLVEGSSNSVSAASVSMKPNVSSQNTSAGKTREAVAQYQETLERELFWRSSNHPSENKIEEKEGSVLFSEEHNYVTGSETFLEILGIEMDEKINWNADGTSELTESQMRYLQNKYDIENLSKNDFYNLLAELSNMNVISHEDVRNQFLCPGNPAAATNGFVVSAADARFSQWLSKENDYLSRLRNEELMYDYLLQALLDGKSSVKASDIFMARSYYEKQKESSGRLAGIFEKLKSAQAVTTEKIKNSFNGLDILGSSAPDEVQEAWDKAEKESGINGMAKNSDGKLTQLTQLFIMSMENSYNGSEPDVLGDSVHSAKEAVQRALSRLGTPKNSEERKEKFFYEAFLRFLR